MNKNSYLTIKCKFKDIINNNIVFDKIINATRLCNKLVIHTYQFIRLFLLFKYDSKQELPLINKDFINSCFIILSKKSSGKAKTATSLNYLNELTEFYNSTYQFLGYDSPQN